MVKMECFLPYLITMVILMFMVYDIFTILKREPFKVFLIDNESGCLSSSPELVQKLRSRSCQYKEIDAYQGVDNDSMIFLSDIGEFPRYNYNGIDGPINGGLPQKGNLSLHLERFRTDMANRLENYTGLISIKVNYWHDEWRFNTETLYQEESKKLSAKVNKHYNDLQMTEQVNQMAQEMFEKSARNFLLETIKQGKALAPKAKWGLLGSPVCTNSYSLDNKSGSEWLFSTSDVAFPELQVHQGNEFDRIRKCIENHSKIKTHHKIKVYLTTKLTYYEKDEFIPEKDLYYIFAQTKNSGYDGIIISINDKAKDSKFCKKLDELLTNRGFGEQIEELTSDWFWGW